MLSIDQLKEIAEDYRGGRKIYWNEYTDAYIGRYEGIVKPKERPRFNRSTGRAYTDAATAKCERSIVKWAKEEGCKAVTYPIKIRLKIIEPAGNEADDVITLSLGGITYHTKGDLDNYAKTVLDALNGVAYRDDKQIAELHLTRRYGRDPGFQILIERCGLTKSELTNFRKVLTWR